MPAHIIIIDLLGLALAVFGSQMAFRQELVRGWWRRYRNPLRENVSRKPLSSDDPVYYALPISGVMLMAFGIAIALLATLFHLASTTGT